MKSTEIFINSKGIGTAEALDVVEDFCQKQSYTKKEMLQTRLLAEELLGMVKGIIGDGFNEQANPDNWFEAGFWMEGEEKRVELHVAARARMDSKKKEKLLSVSSSGENLAAKGVMGKIRQVVENYMASSEEMGQFYAAGAGMMMYPGMMTSGAVMASTAMQTWSLQSYMGAVQQRKEEESSAWDELEKSIVAKLADDVLVGVRNKKVEITVKKAFV